MEAQQTKRRRTAEGGSVARERLLAAAMELFYAEGIHSVGVDRIIEAAGITRATFYRHFPGKEDLVVAYLGLEDASLKDAFAQAGASGADPATMVELVIDGLAQDIGHRHTRGCPFINAAAEFPAADHPVRQVITAHREWFRGQLVELLTAAGHDNPTAGAGQLVLLRDAAMVGGYLDGWDQIRDAFSTAARAAVRLSP